VAQQIFGVSPAIISLVVVPNGRDQWVERVARFDNFSAIWRAALASLVHHKPRLGHLKPYRAPLPNSLYRQFLPDLCRVGGIKASQARAGRIHLWFQVYPGYAPVIRIGIDRHQ